MRRRRDSRTCMPVIPFSKRLAWSDIAVPKSEMPLPTHASKRFNSVLCFKSPVVSRAGISLAHSEEDFKRCKVLFLNREEMLCVSQQ